MSRLAELADISLLSPLERPLKHTQDTDSTELVHGLASDLPVLQIQSGTPIKSPLPNTAWLPTFPAQAKNPSPDFADRGSGGCLTLAVRAACTGPLIKGVCRSALKTAESNLRVRYEKMV